MGIAITVIDDGRPQFLSQAIPSLSVAFPRMPSDHTILVDDSGDPNYAQELLHAYPHIDRQVHHAHRRGLAGALRSAWEAALDFDCEFVFHCEGDFVFDAPIPIGEMSDILERTPFLAQVSLKRQPVNDHEAACGGFIETSPDSYWQQSGYVSHRTCFTFNPSLIPRGVVELLVMSDTVFLESPVTDFLIGQNYYFGIFGDHADPPRTNHIGVMRSAGYRV